MKMTGLVISMIMLYISSYYMLRHDGDIADWRFVSSVIASVIFLITTVGHLAFITIDLWKMIKAHSS